jgi:hypothetical protein
MVVVMLALGGAAPGAHAHETPVDVVTLVEEVAPLTEGLTVQVASSVTTQLVLENATGEVVEVLDDDGRAFLRLDGERVEANFDVASWYRSNDPFGQVDVPATALDDRITDDWRQVAMGPSWGWFDHRLHDGSRSVPGPSEGGGDILDRWVVPLLVGTRPVEVRGVVAFRPPVGTYEAVISRQAAGLVGQVVNGPAPALSVEHLDTGIHVLLGVYGEPFLRFSPEGVEANLVSPTWHQVARAMSSVPLPAELSGTSQLPVWERIAPGRRFTWIDPRLSIPLAAPDDPSFATSVASWSVPVQPEGAPAEATSDLKGEIRWVPASSRQLLHRDRDGTQWGVLVPVLVAAAVAGAGAGGVLRRRRR